MALSLRSCGRAGVGALRWLVGRYVAGAGLSLDFRRLPRFAAACARWMIAAILRQIAAARQPDGSWPMPPLWAWFSHLLST
jgi:hypothetical protein